MDNRIDEVLEKIYCWLGENRIVINGRHAVRAMSASLSGLLGSFADRIDAGAASYEDYEAVCAMMLAYSVVASAVAEEGEENVTLNVEVDEDEEQNS